LGAAIKRSHLVLVGGVALAIAVGAAAAMLAPGPPSPTVGPGNLVFLGGPNDEAPDARVLQGGLLEKLIVEADLADDLAALPSLSTFVLLVERSPDTSGWVIDRLAREDVPGALAVAFARALPVARRQLDGAVHQVLIRHLEGDEAVSRRGAVAVLKARGVLDGTVDRSCDCVVGSYSHGGVTWTVTYDRGGEGSTTVERGGAVDTSEGRL
jgi:hypothetical protein